MPVAAEILLNPGDLLYREGDTNDYAYIIETGEVILYSEKVGRRVDCERRSAGSIVGELSILTGQPRAVTVEAVTPCKAYKISADQILRRFESLDPVLRACIETSINFAARFNSQISTPTTDIPMAPTTLRNAEELINQFKFEKDLLIGLENGEFSLVYQPIIELGNTNVVGFEALMRWQHPSIGNISPEQFITVAEATGSIGKLTDFALFETCAFMKRVKAMSDANEELFASVNISGKDLERREFVDFLAHTLDLHALNPAWLKLEVTETALVSESEYVEKNLKRLRRLGCGLSIDDFGTGYSNLAYLKALPLTALKIDRAFINDVHINAVSRSIVRMLVGLGVELGVDIIGEGMETLKDVETIKELGCRFAQGYYFHRPMPETKLLAILSQSATACRGAA